MKNSQPIINENNHSAACDYIQEKFHAHTWWPGPQPRLAKQQFNLMKNGTGALEVWCNRWLDSGQQRKLQRILKNST
jgi:hypothetical protein